MLVHYDKIMVSDVHLGSKISRSKALTKMLHEESFDELWLIGDIFHDLNFERLNSDDWAFLGYIRELTKTKKVIWIIGNHDWDVYKVMSNLVGVQVYEKYEFTLSDGTLNVAMHGHTLDGMKNSNPFFSKLGGNAMLGLQKIFGNSAWAKRFYKKVDSMERDFSKAAIKVKAGAFKYAKKNGYSRIFCGHTHTPEIAHNEDKSVVYYNTGHWLSDKCSFITLRRNIFNLEYYDGKQ